MRRRTYKDKNVSDIDQEYDGYISVYKVIDNSELHMSTIDFFPSNYDMDITNDYYNYLFKDIFNDTIDFIIGLNLNNTKITGINILDAKDCYIYDEYINGNNILMAKIKIENPKGWYVILEIDTKTISNEF